MGEGQRVRTAAALLAVLVSTAAGSVACSASTSQTLPEPVLNPVPAPAPTPTLSYLALGDSYAAMGSVADNPCARGADNYPAHVRGLLEASHFTDATCQGARVADIGGQLSGPHQARSQADLITLTIGGNDIDFGAIAACAADTGRNCAKELREPTAALLTQVPAKLHETYATIRAAHPNAIVITTGYLPIFAPGDNCASAQALGEATVAWIAEITAQLNAIVRNAALANGAVYVLPDGVEEHGECAGASQSWVALDGTATGSYPAHPTPAGQQAMAEAIAQAVLNGDVVVRHQR